MWKIVVTLAACAIASVIALGCSDFGGIGEGDQCSGPKDNCSSNLTCQPIAGQPGDVCCPTPPQSSNKDTCHPKP
jgi:hypothetical protein